ncbi:NAD-dependent protein deacylase [Phanerochaete sordida]|uniref:NAD-dependent protein deacylase n=1 Tax=Phanerochaete sordida TaxID=48140 RepID=A0A9P3GMG2_9APHY|nr:NAD-dependent protein deacylase [Phanerochaete sordida]
MRISVPTIPAAVLASTSPAKTITPAAAVERIASFLAPGNVATVTGAGVSVDSGIRAYRGSKGRYLNPNYKPIFYQELVDSTEKGFAFRQRYWLRSYLGYKPVRNALPNPTHYALAALQYTNVVPRLITQNVDGLHHKALAGVWTEANIREHILELHGTLHKVHCSHGHVVDRDTFQGRLSAANPQWKAYLEGLEATGQRPRTNPDGDVVLEDVDYSTFKVPECPECLLEDRRNSILKPELIFFGESIRKEVRDRSYLDVENCSRLFLVGTTLATYSAFRLLKHALELKKPVLLLNVGPTRADPLPGVEKIELPSGAVLRDVVRTVLGSRAVQDTVVERMLQSGVVRPPNDDE